MMVFRDFRPPDEVVTKFFYHHVKRNIFPVLLRYRTPKSVLEPGNIAENRCRFFDIKKTTLDSDIAYPFKDETLQLDLRKKNSLEFSKITSRGTPEIDSIYYL